MFTFRKPTETQIREYLARQEGLPYSYEMVGCTQEHPALRRGWNVDHCRVRLGQGESVFRSACAAIERWKMFPPEIATLCWPDQAPREGLIVGVLYWAAPMQLWILFPARVVYALRDPIEEGGRQVERFGFAYGTLRDHPERGEERFLVEWDQRDDSVWYDLLAVSRPAHWLARFGNFYTRWEQARFRRLSCEAMQRAAKS
jgi:uncharacterized protein (UPF0548 family)